MIKDDDNMIAVYSNASIEADNKVTVIFLSMCSKYSQGIRSIEPDLGLTKLLNRKI
jgi:hypothetical protein